MYVCVGKACRGCPGKGPLNEHRNECVCVYIATGTELSLVIKNGRLRRLGCVERKDDANWVRCRMTL